jgi:hypothetical protein
MEGEVSISEWDNNNKSLEFLQIRYTDVLGRFLAKSYSSDSMLKNLLSSKIFPSLLISLMPSSELDIVLL